MSRILWLAYERPPHPDAVCHPATQADVLLVLELLERPEPVRRHMAESLRGMLREQREIVPWQRPSIPCRQQNGWYVLIPWRLAQWLAAVLPATDGLIDRTARRLERWRDRGTTHPVMNATHR